MKLLHEGREFHTYHWIHIHVLLVYVVTVVGKNAPLWQGVCDTRERIVDRISSHLFPLEQTFTLLM